MFGTTPSCFLTASSSGREAAGAASIVAGVGTRDIGVLLPGFAPDSGTPAKLALSKRQRSRQNWELSFQISETSMDRLEAMSTLLAVVDAGSLSAAARRLGTPLATVSRKVSELETHLGTRLLNRSSRRIALTDAGRS